MEEDGGIIIIVIIQMVRPAGCVYMMYADESSEVRPIEAGGRLLTSSTTKLSSLLSASLPCERRERQ